MTDLQHCDLFLVGSIAVPTDTVDEAMHVAVETLGDRWWACVAGGSGASGN
jgi:hypothetical protein